MWMNTLDNILLRPVLLGHKLVVIPQGLAAQLQVAKVLPLPVRQVLARAQAHHPSTLLHPDQPQPAHPQLLNEPELVLAAVLRVLELAEEKVPLVVLLEELVIRKVAAVSVHPNQLEMIPNQMELLLVLLALSLSKGLVLALEEEVVLMGLPQAQVVLLEELVALALVWLEKFFPAKPSHSTNLLPSPLQTPTLPYHPKALKDLPLFPHPMFYQPTPRPRTDRCRPQMP